MAGADDLGLNSSDIALNTCELGLVEDVDPGRDASRVRG
jgi:hypothetical protein